MKYIKTFETNNNEYEKGDYIKLNIQNDVKNFLESYVPDYYDIVKIVRIEDYGHFFYNVIFHNGYDFNVKKDEVVRLATQDEIDEYDTKKMVNKYNL